MGDQVGRDRGVAGNGSMWCARWQTWSTLTRGALAWSRVSIGRPSPSLWKKIFKACASRPQEEDPESGLQAALTLEERCRQAKHTQHHQTAQACGDTSLGTKQILLSKHALTVARTNHQARMRKRRTRRRWRRHGHLQRNQGDTAVKEMEALVEASVRPETPSPRARGHPSLTADEVMDTGPIL